MHAHQGRLVNEKGLLSCSGPATQSTHSLPMKLWTDLGMDMARMNSTTLCPLVQGVTATVSSLLTSLWNLLMACSSLRAIWWKSCVVGFVRRAVGGEEGCTGAAFELREECQLWRPRSTHMNGAARYERLEGQLLHKSKERRCEQMLGLFLGVCGCVGVLCVVCVVCGAQCKPAWKTT